jgi:hypothetical protein
MKTWFATALVILLPFAAPLSKAASSEYAGPKCLGPACIDRKDSFEGLAQQLGGPSSAGGIYGYRADDAQAFLIITEGNNGELGSINLRNFAEFGMWTGKDARLTKKPIQNWKTPEGIGLGTPEEEIVKAYGKPSGVEDLSIEDRHREQGSKALLYRGQLNGAARATRFRLRGGAVSSIELDSDSFVGPDCLGPYCTYGELSLDALLKYFGVSLRGHKPSSVECLQSQDGGSFLHFATTVEETYGVADVLLSDFVNCTETRKQIAPNSLSSWKTPEGVGLGSSEEEILRAYGKPTTEKNVEGGTPLPEMKGLIVGNRSSEGEKRIVDKILVYGPRELQQADFGLRDGRVSYIWLKESDFWLKKDSQ